MPEENNHNLDDFYHQVQIKGKLRTTGHAMQWTRGVLLTLGTSLDRRAKRSLRNALPEELGKHLFSVFWLLHFRNKDLTGHEFRLNAARRSGNSDAEFARYPTLGVFAGIKQFIDPELDEKISGVLSPEVSQMWQDSDKAN